MENIQPNDIH
jgi:hypothetical protein